MSNDRLLPCVSCSRHVRVTDAMCPFCATDLSATVRSPVQPRSPVTRLSRAALYAFGASAAAVAACGGSTAGTATDGGTDASSESSTIPDPNPQPPYGAPPVDGGEDARVLREAAPPDAADAGEDATSFPLYGAPPP